MTLKLAVYFNCQDLISDMEVQFVSKYYIAFKTVLQVKVYYGKQDSMSG